LPDASDHKTTPSWAAAVKPVEQPKNEPVKVNERPVTANKKGADKKKSTTDQEEAPKKVQETPKPNPPAQEKKNAKVENAAPVAPKQVAEEVKSTTPA
jgi:hypothetical protein